jgi:hypothetical protein
METILICCPFKVSLGFAKDLEHYNEHDLIVHML